MFPLLQCFAVGTTQLTAAESTRLVYVIKSNKLTLTRWTIDVGLDRCCFALLLRCLPPLFLFADPQNWKKGSFRENVNDRHWPLPIFQETPVFLCPLPVSSWHLLSSIFLPIYDTCSHLFFFSLQHISAL